MVSWIGTTSTRSATRAGACSSAAFGKGQFPRRHPAFKLRIEFIQARHSEQANALLLCRGTAGRRQSSVRSSAIVAARCPRSILGLRGTETHNTHGGIYGQAGARLRCHCSFPVRQNVAGCGFSVAGRRVRRVAPDPTSTRRIERPLFLQGRKEEPLAVAPLDQQDHFTLVAQRLDDLSRHFVEFDFKPRSPKQDDAVSDIAHAVSRRTFQKDVEAHAMKIRWASESSERRRSSGRRDVTP